MFFRSYLVPQDEYVLEFHSVFMSSINFQLTTIMMISILPKVKQCQLVGGLQLLLKKYNLVFLGVFICIVLVMKFLFVGLAILLPHFSLS